MELLKKLKLFESSVPQHFLHIELPTRLPKIHVLGKFPICSNPRWFHNQARPSGLTVQMRQLCMGSSLRTTTYELGNNPSLPWFPNP